MTQIPSPKIKSYFLGPQAENAEIVKKLGNFIFGHWFSWRKKQFPNDGKVITHEDQMAPEFRAELKKIKFQVLDLVARLQKEVPSFSPRYIGHMVSEISLPALMGHFITLVHNPNNITGEVARVSIEIEREAIGEVMRMLGFSPENSRGHFTSGGTVANIEGLVRARSRVAKWLAAGTLAFETQQSSSSLFELAHQGWDSFDQITAKHSAEEIRKRHFLHSNPIDVARRIDRAFGLEYQGPIVLAPSSKHYCWPKAIILMGLGAESFWPVELDKTGGMSTADLRKKIDLARKHNRPILGVVSVAGTTELGDFDPIHEVQDTLDDLRNNQNIHIWHHIDAAYGGFFRCIADSPESPLTTSTHAALKAIERADSVTVDPHKLGYVPYASGAFVCKNASEYYVAPFDAPYLRFDYDSNKMPQTLEGSRSAGGAMSTWLTAKCIGFNPEGYGQILSQTVRQRQRLEQKLAKLHPAIKLAPHSETNILCFAVAKDKEGIKTSNERALKIYEAFNNNDSIPFFVSMTSLKWDNYGPYLNDFVAAWGAQIDDSKLTLIRLTLMNPFFESASNSLSYGDEFAQELLKVITAINKD